MFKRLMFLLSVMCVFQQLPLAARTASIDTMQNFKGDSLTKPSILPDSSQIRPAFVTIDQWSAQTDSTLFSNDTLWHPAYRFKDLIYLNYTGLGDVFRRQPGIWIYDFLEMNLPRYVAPLHLWPQQNIVRLNEIPLNDPLSGMFNTRLIYPDALQAAYLNATGLPRVQSRAVQKTDGLILLPRVLNPEEPYTRIMYREGDFGYTDLDITFARRLGRRTLLQLGGINRDYGPVDYRGTHYRGRLTFIPAARFITTFTYRKSSENVTFPDRLRMAGGPFRRNEVWEWFAAKVGHLTPKGQHDWLLTLLFNDSRRHYRLFESTLRPRLRFDRLLLRASKNGNYGLLRYRLEGSGEQIKAWGSVYRRKYTDSRFTAGATLGVDLPDSMRITLATNLRYRWAQPLQLEPTLRLRWRQKCWSLYLNASRYARFASLNERYFQYQNIHGTYDVSAEHHSVLRLSLNVLPDSWSRMMVGVTVHDIRNEIGFNGTTFFNGGNRRFAFAQARSSLKFYKFELHGGGQVGLAGELLGSDYSGFAQVRYHDRWIHGHLLVDATGTVRYYGPFKNLAFVPIVEHFYRLPGQSDGFFLLSYKLVATVKDAHLFMEMDNPLGLTYHIITGYSEVYRRVRFGVSWVLRN